MANTNTALAFIEHRKVVPIEARQSDAQMVLSLTAPVGPPLSIEDRAEAERRYGVIEPLVDAARYPLLYSMYPSQGDRIDYLAKQHNVKRATIYRWVKLFKSGKLSALVNKDRCDKGKARVMNTAAMELLVAMSTGHWTLAEMYRAYCEERAWRAAHTGRRMGDFESMKYARYLDEDGRLKTDAQLPEISRETLRRWFERVPEFIRVLARGGEEAFHNTQELLSYRDLEALEPMDYVVMDHRLLDIFCLAPGVQRGDPWRLVRPWLTAAIDMRTRKWLGWVIVESPSSDSIAAVLKKVFVNHGLPKALYWDNGKDFVCEWFEGSRESRRTAPPIGEMDTTWRGVLGSLDIRVHHAIPFRARAKIIEPNFGRISKFDMSLAEWCGNKPSARPERFEAMAKEYEKWAATGEGTMPAFHTIGEISARYDDAIEDLNEREMEGALGMRKVRAGGGYAWRSPNECWDVLIPRVTRRTVPAELISMLFAKRRRLTVQHSAVTVTFDGQQFHYRVGGQQLARLNGKQVELAYDPLDLEMAAIYYEGCFFGIASCVALRRMGEDAFTEDERDRRRLLRESKRFITAAHQLVPVAGPETRLMRRRAVAPVRPVAVRVEVPVALPAPIVEAGRAARDERAVSFDAAAVEIDVVGTPAAAAADDDDGAFNFFK